MRLPSHGCPDSGWGQHSEKSNGYLRTGEGNLPLLNSPSLQLHRLGLGDHQIQGCPGNEQKRWSEMLAISMEPSPDTKWDMVGWAKQLVTGSHWPSKSFPGKRTGNWAVLGALDLVVPNSWSFPCHAGSGVHDIHFSGWNGMRLRAPPVTMSSLAWLLPSACFQNASAGASFVAYLTSSFTRRTGQTRGTHGTRRTSVTGRSRSSLFTGLTLQDRDMSQAAKG